MFEKRKHHEIERRGHLIEKYYDLDEFFDAIWKFDPTRHGEFTNWVISCILRNDFQLHDWPTVKSLLQKFNKLKPKLKKSGKSSDINKYAYADLCYLIDFVENPIVDFSYSAIDDVIVHYDGEHGTLVTPLTKESSIKLGSGTKWCSSAVNENQFHIYDDGPLFIWMESSGKYQFHFTTPESANHHNVHLSKDEIAFFRHEHPVLKQLFSHQEMELAESARDSYYYSAKMIFDRFYDGESIIAKSPSWAYFYARDVLKDRFLIAESKIKSSVTYKRLYDSLGY